ncbi:hypothetical protein FQN50_007160 [Emmonsiellopsis sp. PD_5]|nr:hypothetical protein FQN50_007160 [Emmonsiellopsis sp. PD_5]
MGASSSKPIKSAAGTAARRQYPKRPSPSTRTTPKSAENAERPRQPGPVFHSKEKASTMRSEAIDLDARDPHFAASLRSLGPVTPSPTLSNSSTFNQPPQPHTPTSPSPSPQSQSPPPSPSPETTTNPALLILSARSQLESAAAHELATIGRQSHAGREFLDVMTIKQILAMRDVQGVEGGVIERRLRLRGGVVGVLGGEGVVGVVR